jgi:arylsulfatase A
MKSRPNIVYFLVDDMGYGDVACLNPRCRIPTPNFDRHAREGMIFRDAHSTSAVCSPSRYSILTGRYNWRSTLQKGIVGHYGDPLIAPDRLTVPGFLGSLGYHSACVGKWHLGMGWDFDVDGDFLPDRGKYDDPDYPGDPVPTSELLSKWEEAFSKPTTGGPTTRGFDRYFGVDVPNWPPYCFIEDDRTVGIPSGFLPPRLLGHNQASTPGPAMPYWHFEQLLPKWAQEADRYIRTRSRSGEPFFLYLPMTSPHTPLSPNAKWVGASGLGSRYADLVMETDDVFGRVLDSLDRAGVRENTIVFLASDNGFAHYAGATELEAQGHYPSAHYRGYKSDAWDGGHRIPFIASCPGLIEAGSVCDELVSLGDLFATCADLTGEPLPDGAGEDSVSLLPLLRGERRAVRDHVVHHSINGKFAIRDGRWKLVLCPGSGGWAKNDEEAAREGLPILQLYDMGRDPGETKNLHDVERSRVRDMITLLERIVSRGRSTPGPDLRNDAEVDIWKLDTIPSADASVLDDY